MLWLEAAVLAMDLLAMGQHGWTLAEVDQANSAAAVAAVVRRMMTRGNNGLSSVDERPVDLSSRDDFDDLFAQAVLALLAFRRGEVDSVRELAMQLSRVIVPPDDDGWPTESAFRDVLTGRRSLPRIFQAKARSLAITIASAAGWNEFVRRQNAAAPPVSNDER